MRLLLAAATLSATAAFADTINVPADAPTIQAAIDLASDNDVVNVSPGTYLETIDLHGKAITLQGTNATIDAGASGSAITCTSGEGPDTVITGFKIVGGTGSVIHADAVTHGGALVVVDASPTITHCNIQDCTADTGAGFYFENADIDMQHCTFSGNHAIGDNAYAGAIHAVASTVDLLHCTFFVNTASTGFNGSGGAIAAENGSNLTLDECHFHANVAKDHGGAIYCQSSQLSVAGSPFHVNEAAHGGAISCLNGPYALTNCLIYGGEATSGAGINAQHADATITGCDISANIASSNGAGLSTYASDTIIRATKLTLNISGGGGAGVSTLEGSTDYVNCLFLDNAAAGLGGAILNMQAPTTFVNCTFDENHSDVDGGAIYSHAGAHTSIANSILSANTPNQLGTVEGATTTVAWSNVQGGYDGIGNIDADPLYVDPLDPREPDFSLTPGSPAADAGDNDAVPRDVTFDFAGLPRFADDPQSDDTGHGDAPIVDMGAFETQPAACAADINGDGNLNALDFIAFQNAWVAQNPAADCNGDGNYNILDFVCFQSLFLAGCP